MGTYLWWALLLLQLVRGASDDEIDALIRLSEAIPWLQDPNGWIGTLICDWKGIFCGVDGSVVSLEINGENLANGSLPTQIGRIANLQTLNLTGFRLKGTIPTQLGLLGSLTILSLTRANLHGTIPDTFLNLWNVLHVDLSNNQLSGTIPNPPNCGVQVLLLNNNSLNEPLDFAESCPFRIFDISNNLFSGALPAFVQATETLESINLSTNPWTPQTIPYHYFNLSTLKTLDLSQARLTGTTISFAGKAFSSIKRLNLANNSIAGIFPFYDIFKQGRNLKDLFLQNNQGLGGIYPSMNDTFQLKLLNLDLTGTAVQVSCPYYGMTPDYDPAVTCKFQSAADCTGCQIQCCEIIPCFSECITPISLPTLTPTQTPTPTPTPPIQTPTPTPTPSPIPPTPTPTPTPTPAPTPTTVIILPNTTVISNQTNSSSIDLQGTLVISPNSTLTISGTLNISSTGTLNISPNSNVTVHGCVLFNGNLSISNPDSHPVINPINYECYNSTFQHVFVNGENVTCGINYRLTGLFIQQECASGGGGAPFGIIFGILGGCIAVVLVFVGLYLLYTRGEGNPFELA